MPCDLSKNLEDSYNEEMYLSSVMQDPLFLSLCQGIRGYNALFPVLTPRCRYHCVHEEEVEHFRMFFYLLALSSIILKAPLLSYPHNRVVTKISSCRVYTTSRRDIRLLGIYFGSIFLLFSNKSSQGPLS